MSIQDENYDEEQIDLGEGMSADKAKNAKATNKRLFSYLMQQKWKLIIVSISTIFCCAFTLAAPLVIGDIINELYNAFQLSLTSGQAFVFDASAIGASILILLVLYLFSAAFNYLQQYLMAGVSQKLALTLRTEISEKLSKLPLSFYDKNKKGTIMSRVTNDLEKVADTLQFGLLQFITAVVTILGALIIMVNISPLLTLITVITIIVGMIATFFIANKSHKRYSDNQKALGEMNGLIEEFFTGQVVVKAFHKEEDALNKVKEANKVLYQASKRAQFITNAINPAIRLFNQFGYVLMAVLGALLVISGRLSLGIIQAFFQYVTQVSEPVTEASYVFNSMQAAIASAERVFTILDEEEEIADNQHATLVTNPKGKVEFSHVKFGYTDNHILMDDIDIHVKPGQKIAIVGPTGAGKTTLVNLLMRFYEVQGGTISIDGLDIKKMSRGNLRSLFGMVLQDTWLFGGTIADNIAYSSDKIDKSLVKSAAVDARADHFIRTLSKGYDTHLNDEGSNISQGQRQLLTIARAMLADPPILILDEATSSVDTRTELEIQKAMDRLMKGRTSFVIAHRLSTILDADCILVMNNGTIIEQGNHKELMLAKGFYADLYNSQFAV